MSAIDMSIDVQKIEEPTGTPRMVLTLNGKWLHYKKF
jgi:cyanate lyase